MSTSSVMDSFRSGRPLLLITGNSQSRFYSGTDFAEKQVVGKGFRDRTCKSARPSAPVEPSELQNSSIDHHEKAGEQILMFERAVESYPLRLQVRVIIFCIPRPGQPCMALTARAERYPVSSAAGHLLTRRPSPRFSGRGESVNLLE